MLENAAFQWRTGGRRVRDAPALQPAVDSVVAELRKRLGGPFTLGELAELYAAGTEWAEVVARRRAPAGDAAAVVDAAFGLYAREARNWAGGRALDEV